MIRFVHGHESKIEQWLSGVSLAVSVVAVLRAAIARHRHSLALTQSDRCLLGLLGRRHHVHLQ